VNCSACCRDGLDMFGTATVLNKHVVTYYRCSLCGFIQTEKPYWLEEAYATAITNTDIGLVRRNVSMSRVCEAVILLMFDANGAFLDYGGGYGMLTRMMRDRGFDFFRFDAWAPNLFAADFECVKGRRYELVTAFEVFEHLAEPRSELEAMLTYSRNVLFSTRLIPDRAPPIAQWWYYSPEHGQHVSFYSRKALEAIAGDFGLYFQSDGRSVHLFSERKIGTALFAAASVVSRVAPWLFSPLRVRLRKRDLLNDDYFQVTGKKP